MPLVKILTGIRRCGKSVILQLYADELRAMGVPEKNILFLKFTSYYENEISNDKELYNKVCAFLENSEKETGCYIFLDEIQEVNNWEKAVNALADELEKATGVRPPLYNLSSCDMYEAVAMAFKYS